MQVSATTILLAAVVVGAAAYALLGNPPAPSEAPRAMAPPEEVHPDETMPELPPEDPEGVADPASDEMEDIAPDNEPATIEWSVPAGWKTVPSPSSMRIATYSVGDAEVSVVRAGGDESANVQRWVDQFGGATAKRRTQKVHGLDVTLVELEGAYTNTMVPNGSPQPGWALVAAIVRAPGQPYFFKMTGPVATVRGAQAAFAKLVESIKTVD
jgi:hypothetical protein